MGEIIIAEYGDAYPELQQNKEKVLAELQKEEEKFRTTLEQGIKQFGIFTKDLSAGDTISAKDAFDLYQSYGFPIDMTIELAEENGLVVDKAGFEKEVASHQALSRSGAEQKFKGGLADSSEMSIKYHTATHLLHAALQEVLGPHAKQRGSNINDSRLRFDFEHGEKMTPEEKQQVEDLVNAAIAKDYPVTYTEMPIEEAKAKGAIGLFGDKYDDVVKVYTVGNPDGEVQASNDSETFSRELCGGPHVERTGDLGNFRIKKEQSSSSGIRRIKAILE